MVKPAPIAIRTEPIGSIPRPNLIDRVAKGDAGLSSDLVLRIDPHIEIQRKCGTDRWSPGENYRW
jgi:hypothetical protein